MKSTEYRIDELDRRVKLLEALLLFKGKDSSNESKILSPREFLLSKTLKSEIQKTLTLGYYLEHKKGMSSFNAVDLVNIFYVAKEKPPVNINDAVNKNIIQGFLMDAIEKKGNKKTWILTSSGEKYVEENFKKLT